MKRGQDGHRSDTQEDDDGKEDSKRTNIKMFVKDRHNDPAVNL